MELFRRHVQLTRAVPTALLILLLIYQTNGHEKIFRKVVRDKLKMVQQPFSSDTSLSWRDNNTHPVMRKAPYFSIMPSEIDKAMYRSQRSRKFLAAEKKYVKTTLSVVTLPKNKNAQDRSDVLARTQDRAAETYFIGDSAADNTIDTPDNKDKSYAQSERRIAAQNGSIPDALYFDLKPKGLIEKLVNPESHGSSPDTINDGDAPDFLLEEMSKASPNIYQYKKTTSSCTCLNLKEASVDIDLQETFLEFNLQATLESKNYWNDAYDARYETLMRDSTWPSLKVILVPRAHVDSIWKQTFDQYHKNSVNKILTNMVKKLQFYTNMTFSWNEVSHLSRWWKTAPEKIKNAFRRLVKAGRLEITTGGFVEPDEATSHIYGLVHQLVHGHQWLKRHLNYEPKVAWLTNSVTHSPTIPYLLSSLGIWRIVFTNVHYEWKRYFTESQMSDFIWLQNWDARDSDVSYLNQMLLKYGNERLPNTAVLLHYLQFNAAGIDACGPYKKLCNTQFNFAYVNKNVGINDYNLKEKAELLLEQYSKTGTISQHNVVLAPIGDPFSYVKQSEFDYQYSNYHKLAEFVNSNKDIYKASIKFGTVEEFFDSILNKFKNYPTVKGDFLNFADIKSGLPAYWTGFFTSRPMVKILLRRLESSLRSAEILFAFANTYNVFDGLNISLIHRLLQKARNTLARLMDRNVSSGTLSVNALKFIYNEILNTAKDCWNIQEVSASRISSKTDNKEVYLQKYLYRDGEFISVFRSVMPGDAIYVFNSLTHERIEIMELITQNPTVGIVDYNKKEINVQVVPIWRYSSKKIKIANRFYRIFFIIVIPPMTLQMFRIKANPEKSSNIASVFCTKCDFDDYLETPSTIPFVIRPIEAGDIQIENYKYRLLFDEASGFLKTVIDKQTNMERPIQIDYKAFRTSNINAGMFLFTSNNTKPIWDIFEQYKMGYKSKLVIIISGPVATEVTFIYGRLLQHTVRVVNVKQGPLSEAIAIESRVDYEAAPKNRELEIFMSIKSDIENGPTPEIFTDNNGFQYTRRTLKLSKRIETFLYPMTTMAYIQDRSSRLTLITDHAQGVTSLQQGQLTVLLDRRVMFDDGRGTGEALADSTATCHRHYLLLEHFIEPENPNKVSLPSYTALHLSNTVNNLLDVFTIDKNQTDLCYFAFFPLVKISFPSDVTVLNMKFMEIEQKNIFLGSPQHLILLFLHKQTYSCQILHSNTNCNVHENFYPQNVFRNLRAFYLSNLSGTSNGLKIDKLDRTNFPPMEIVTLRMLF